MSPCRILASRAISVAKPCCHRPWGPIVGHPVRVYRRGPDWRKSCVILLFQYLEGFYKNTGSGSATEFNHHIEKKSSFEKYVFLFHLPECGAIP